MSLVVRIADGVEVCCRWCGKEHTVRGYTGNNLRWEDAEGWIGSYDVAHGPFESTQSNACCPECQNKSPEEKEQLIQMRIDSMMEAAPHSFAIRGYQAIEKTVTPGSQSSSRVYVPKGWEGKRVMVVLLDHANQNPRRPDHRREAVHPEESRQTGPGHDSPQGRGAADRRESPAGRV